MIRIRHALSLLASLLLVIPLQAQSPVLPPNDSYEFWYGVIEGQDHHLRTLFSWRKDSGNGPQGTLLSFDQRMTEAPIGKWVKSERALLIEVPKLQGRFEGTLLDADHALGQWKQGEASIPLSLQRIMALPEDHPELVLSGTLSALFKKLDLQFRFYDLKKEGNSVRSGRGYFDSLTEKIGSILCEFEEREDRVSIRVPAIQATFEGKMGKEKELINGLFKQGPIPIPLVLKKIQSPQTMEAASAIHSQPGSSESPSPSVLKASKEIREADFQIIHGADKALIAGTLSLPKEKGKYPAMILISGSGPQDRDSTILHHRPFRTIAHFLAEKGFAVIRYDDRGVGKSRGPSSEATLEDLAKDVQILLRYAAHHEEIEPTKIGLLGHSEGGIIAPLVATWEPDVSAVVMLAPSMFPGDVILEQQADRIAELEGASEEYRRISREMRREIHSHVTSLFPSDDPAEELRKILRRYWKPLRESAQSKLDKSPSSDQENRNPLPEPVAPVDLEQVAQAFESLRTPWFQRFMNYDPAPTMMVLRCPALGLWGELDSQVLARENMERCVEAIARGGNPDTTLAIVPGVNHLFLPAKTGSPTEYGTIHGSLDHRVLEIVAEWLQGHLNEERVPSR